MRGSGVRGLAAMEARSAIARTRLLRPLLPVSRAQLEQFARVRGLNWSEDASNVDERFDRNYLRRAGAAALRERWPAAAATASRSAAHLRRGAGPARALGAGALRRRRPTARRCA